MDNTKVVLTVSVWHSQAVPKAAWISAEKCGNILCAYIVHVWLDKEKPVPIFLLGTFCC